MSSSLSTSLMRVARLNFTCLVPGNHPSPFALRRQIEDLVKKDFAFASSQVIAPLCPDHDPSVWFIRRVNMSVTADLSCETKSPVHPLATQFVRSVSRAMACGKEGEDVLHFPDRAAYVAQFLSDLADGSAWGKWYYAQFDGLRNLLTSAALREALCREPTTAEASLLQLASQGRLDKVLRGMCESDCSSVLEMLSRTGSGTETLSATTNDLETVWHAWQRSTGFIDDRSGHRAALRLYLALRHSSPAPSPSPTLKAAVYAFLALLRWMTSPPARRLLAALRRANTSAVFTVPRGDDTEALTTLLACERHVVVKIAEQLCSWPQGALTSAEAGVLTTPFGGVFHLLQRIDELDLDMRAAALPDFGGSKPLPLIRFLIVLKCLGSARAPRAFLDPLLRQIMGVAVDMDARSIRTWARTVTHEVATDFQARWATASVRRGSACVGKRWLRIHAAKKSRLLVLADCDPDTWLLIACSTRELTTALAQKRADLCPEMLLCDPALMQALPVTVAGTPARAWNSPDVVDRAENDTLLANCLKRLSSPDSDLSYLTLAELFRGAPHLDRALSLPARAALRAFAWRLPGFASSSADYLYTNFLDVTATIEMEARQWSVRLGRPPLHVVLAMSGAAQDKYSLSWLGGQRVQLTTADR